VKAKPEHHGEVAQDREARERDHGQHGGRQQIADLAS
jgi:hypothetical protein